MDLVQIDVVGLQPFQRFLAGPHDVQPRVPGPVGARLGHEVVQRNAAPPPAVVDLGGQQDGMAKAALLDRLADDLLTHALGVDITRVDEVDARLEGSVEDSCCVLGRCRIAKIVGAEA